MKIIFPSSHIFVTVKKIGESYFPVRTKTDRFLRDVFVEVVFNYYSLKVAHLSLKKKDPPKYACVRGVAGVPGYSNSYFCRS